MDHAIRPGRDSIRARVAVPAAVLPRVEIDSRRGTVGPGLLAGVVLAVPYFLQAYAVRETTASMGGFVTGLIVLLVAVGGRMFFGARFGVRSVTGLCLG